MIELSTDGDLKNFTDELWLAGIVTQIERFRIKDFEKDSFELHKRAAVGFMEQQQNKAVLDAKKYATEEIKEEDCWHVKIYSFNPNGRKISLEEFIGDKELNGIAHGLYSAFMDPPYGIFKKERKDEMYKKLYNMLFPSEDHPVEIYSWDTDWSNYFDAGKEWWGCYLWTILTDYGESVIVIGVSQTD